MITREELKEYLKKINDLKEDVSSYAYKEDYILNIHPLNIYTSKLIGTNKNKAFESYNLEGSSISPMCFDCAEKYSTALNVLLKNKYVVTPEGRPIGGLPKHNGAEDFEEGEEITWIRSK